MSVVPVSVVRAVVRICPVVSCRLIRSTCDSALLTRTCGASVLARDLARAGPFPLDSPSNASKLRPAHDFSQTMQGSRSPCCGKAPPWPNPGQNGAPRLDCDLHPGPDNRPHNGQRTTDNGQPSYRYNQTNRCHLWENSMTSTRSVLPNPERGSRNQKNFALHDGWSPGGAGQENRNLQGPAGDPATDPAAPGAAFARPGADGRQPRFRPGAARLHQVPGGRHHRQAPFPEAPSARRRGADRHADPGNNLLLADADAVEGGAEADRRTAAAGAGARRPPAGGLLRLQQDRHAGVAHHERRGGRAQPDRHRAGGFRRRTADRGHRLRRAHPHQPADDRHRLRLPAGLRRRPAQGVSRDSSHLPRARQDQRRGHRTADRIAGRRARGEGLPRRGARA